MAELGESLNHLLTGLEDLGLDSLPVDLEIDMRHTMNMESPPPSFFHDEHMSPEDFMAAPPFGADLSPEECNNIAQLF